MSLQALTANMAEYRTYLASMRNRFPKSTYELATSDWYYNARDHRCPHDAWLERLDLTEVASGERKEVRSLSLRVRLLGAYHDRYIEYWYPEVHRYDLGSERAASGHGDWLYDEFRLSESGLVLHEIEWAEGGHWLIEATDVDFSCHPLPPA
jgi:hypothetical protein